MQLLLYIIIYPILYLLSLLPLRILYIKSSALYYLVYHILGYRKNVVMNNLNLVFPDKSNLEKNEIAKKFYRHLCDLIIETIKGITISEKEIMERMHFENLGDLDVFFQDKKSILLMAGHYANWEWSGILNKLLKHEAHAVYKPLDNLQMNTMIKNIRSRFGGKIITNKKIASLLYRKLKAGNITLTYILSDQTPKMGAFKHRDTFMGIDVPVFTGTEELAKKLNFSVFYLKVKKISRGHYSSTFVKLADEPTDFPDFEITRNFLDELEAQIKEEPQYYLWSHNRWKLRDDDK